MIKTILEMSALILSIVNGAMLFKEYLRDRPVLAVVPVHPETYQWFFKLPDGLYQGNITTKFGFLVYVNIKNKGIRNVQLDYWRLFIENKSNKLIELKPMSIPEPSVELGSSGHQKVYQVLGQKGPMHDGSTYIESGSSVSGFAYYIIEFFGSEEWNPKLKDGIITGRFIAKGIMGNKAKSKIEMREVSIDYVTKMIPDIDKIDLQ